MMITEGFINDGFKVKLVCDKALFEKMFSIFKIVGVDEDEEGFLTDDELRELFFSNIHYEVANRYKPNNIMMFFNDVETSKVYRLEILFDTVEFLNGILYDVRNFIFSSHDSMTYA